MCDLTPIINGQLYNLDPVRRIEFCQDSDSVILHMLQPDYSEIITGGDAIGFRAWYDSHYPEKAPTLTDDHDKALIRIELAAKEALTCLQTRPIGKFAQAYMILVGAVSHHVRTIIHECDPYFGIESYLPIVKGDPSDE